MKKLCLVVSLFLTLGLSGCGGGGSDTGSGGDSSFDLTPFIGDWLGSINAVGTVFGQTVTFNKPLGLNIRSDGLITNLDSDDRVCQGLESEFLTSNPYSWSDSYQCFSESIGLCEITETGTVTITGNTAIGSITQDAICGAGNTPINIKGDFALTKQT